MGTLSCSAPGNIHFHLPQCQCHAASHSQLRMTVTHFDTDVCGLVLQGVMVLREKLWHNAVLGDMSLLPWKYSPGWEDKPMPLHCIAVLMYCMA